MARVVVLGSFFFWYKIHIKQEIKREERSLWEWNKTSPRINRVCPSSTANTDSQQPNNMALVSEGSKTSSAFFLSFILSLLAHSCDGVSFLFLFLRSAFISLSSLSPHHRDSFNVIINVTVSFVDRMMLRPDTAIVWILLHRQIAAQKNRYEFSAKLIKSNSQSIDGFSMCRLECLCTKFSGSYTFWIGPIYLFLFL